MKRSSLDLRLTERLQIQARARLEIKNRESHGYHSFVSLVAPHFIWYRHCEVLESVFERVASKELRNVMVFVPPRHSKSEMGSRLLPAYLLYKYPRAQVGLSSYAADLAHGLSRNARDNYERAERRVKEDASAIRLWETQEGGGMWAAGVGGPITGKGFNFGIIDDPFKNYEEASSERIRRTRIEWYDSTWFTRREPDACEILIMTRWHQADLAGYLLAKEEHEPRGWHIVHLEAIKEKDAPVYPPSCTVEADWREEGKALCPERYDEKSLKFIKGQAGSAFWISMYQQKPRENEGNVWKRTWFKRFNLEQTLKRKKEDKEFVELLDVGDDWDLAYTENDRNSACARVRAARDKNNNIYIMDVEYRFVEFPELIRWMMAVDGPHYVEAKASGKSAVQTLKAQTVAAREVSIQGSDKISRTVLVTPIAENGQVFVADHIAEKLLDDPKQGLTYFPSGTHDDVNDAFVQALNRLFKRKEFRFGFAASKQGNDRRGLV